jgi:hypothetical protein
MKHSIIELIQQCIGIGAELAAIGVAGSGVDLGIILNIDSISNFIPSTPLFNAHDWTHDLFNAIVYIAFGFGLGYMCCRIFPPDDDDEDKKKKKKAQEERKRLAEASKKKY